jgi:hypothetical protein
VTLGSYSHVLPAFAAGSDVEDGHAGPCRRARIMPLQIGHPLNHEWPGGAGRARSGDSGPGGTGLERHPAPRQAARRAWSQRGATAPAAAGSAALPPARARWADSEVGGLEVTALSAGGPAAPAPPGMLCAGRAGRPAATHVASSGPSESASAPGE